MKLFFNIEVYQTKQPKVRVNYKKRAKSEQGIRHNLKPFF